MKRLITFLAIAIAIATAIARTAVPLHAISPGVVVSQVYGGGGNSGATLKNDFIELFNRGSAPVSLAGWSVQYAAATGSTWQVTSLTGVLQPGHYHLVQEAQGTGGTTNLPPSDATGAIPMSATAGKVAVVSSTTALSGACPIGGAIVDFVGYGGANCSETTPTATLSNTTAAVRKNGGDTDTDNNAADFAIGSPNPRNSGFTPTPPTELAIHDIQGAGPTSPYVNQLVATDGIVTSVKSNGFFIQSSEAGYDGDPRTSEGVFVFTSLPPPTAASIGNLVRVTGRVSEFVPNADPASPPATELTAPSVSLLSTGNPLPTPILLTAADTDPSGQPVQLERFEGMRVHVDLLIATAPTLGSINETNATSTSNGVFYGVITGIARPFREPGIEIFDPLPPGAPTAVPRFDSNPERLRVDSRALGGPILNVTSGAAVENLTGPLDFGFRTYTIDVEAASQASVSGVLTAPIPVRPPGPNEFTIATANLERFFDTVDDPGISDAVLTPAAFDNRLNKASLEIRTVMMAPDIVGLEEIENIAVLEALANKVNGDAIANGDPDPGYKAYLEEGNDIGGIDSGFLVKASRVSVVDVTQEGKDTTFVNPDGTVARLNDRPPLILRATVTPDPAVGAVPITVIVNHLRSLSGIGDPIDGDRIRHKRQAQAEFLANLIQARQSANPDERIVSVGDYNAFPINDGYVDSIGTIKGTPAPADTVTLASPDLVNPDLVDLIDFAPADQRYSFVFDGNAQEIDHILVTENIASLAGGIEYGRTNADFPEAFRNNANSPVRTSDHDPIVSYFNFPITTLSYGDTTSEAGLPTTLSFTLRRFDGIPIVGAPLSIGIGPSSFAPVTDAVGVATVSVTLGVGTYDVTASYAGDASQFLLGSKASGTFRVVDTTPPMIASVTSSRTSLWPPNKKMTPIAIGVAVADVADPNPACAVTGVTSNEAASGAWSLPGGLSVNLRADRNGNGDGRVYTIAVACTDASGNVANATTGVVVPHDQR